MRYSHYLISAALSLMAFASPAYAIKVAPQHCQGADWHAQGIVDGQHGRSISRLSQFRDACAVHGMTVDMAAYRMGREKGLSQYCSTGTALRAGQNNRSAGICTSPKYQQAHRLGLDVRNLAARLAHVTDELRAAHGQRRRHAVSPLRHHSWYRYSTGVNQGAYIDKYRYGSYGPTHRRHDRSSYNNTRYTQTLVPNTYDRYNANAHHYSNTRSRHQYLREEQKRLRLQLNERRRALHDMQLKIINRSDLPQR